MLLAVGAAQAQCFTNVGGASQAGNLFSVWGGYTIQDEGRSVLAIPLGFTFPMPTTHSPALTCNRMWIGTNGVIYLSDANYGLVAPVQYLIQDITSLRSTAFGSPRLLPYSRDLDAGGVSPWDIKVNTSTPNQITVTFEHAARYFTPTDDFSFSATLYSNGVVDYSYDGNVPADGAWVGLSIGNGVGTGTEVAQPFGAGNSGTLGLLYGVVDIGSEVATKTIRYTPNGLGGYTSSFVCSGAYNQAYGKGCYGPQASQAVYQEFTTPAAAATLTGQSMVATPTANGYLFTWGGGAYVAPTGGATTLTLTDDSETDVTPSIAFPTPTGSVPVLSVCSNGFVNMAPSGSNTPFAYGSVFALLNATVASFRSNADYDPTSSPGAIKTEEVGGVLYVTWENIERYNTAGVSDRWQFQLNLGTGTCTYVWDSMQGTVGGACVVGYSPGTSLDPLSITLATALPVVTSPDYNGVPLELSASPAPVYSAGNPSVPVTWTVNNVPDAVPPFGIGLSFLLFSVAPIPGGFDLGFLGMPGCDLNILTLDVTIGFTGTVPSDSLTFSVPQPLSPGLSFYAQALSLFPPNSLPNGQNPFGGLLSNGVQSYFNVF